jgi:hypothetical protein
MGYAVKRNGAEWRMVSSADDILDGGWPPIFPA